jgi:hypothetical protein
MLGFSLFVVADQVKSLFLPRSIKALLDGSAKHNRPYHTPLPSPLFLPGHRD